jgi:hypothetical protein
VPPAAPARTGYFRPVGFFAGAAAAFGPFFAPFFFEFFGRETPYVCLNRFPFAVRLSPRPTS